VYLQPKERPLFSSCFNTLTPPPNVTGDAGIFTGSPAVVQLPGTSATRSSGEGSGVSSGDLLASHDYFGASTLGVLKQVFRSRDEGVSWTLAGSVSGMYWSNLFVHKTDGYVYMLGTNGTDIHKTSPPNLTPMKVLSPLLPSFPQTRLSGN